MADTPQQETALQRRIKYGLNVTLASLIALALVVGVNVMLERGVQRMSAKSRKMVRWDLTGTGTYSLSDQTENLLDRLDEPIHIVSLMDPEQDERKRTIDLIREYDEYSDQITSQIIDPAKDLEQRDEFYESIHERFEGRLKPVRDAVEAGHKALEQARADLRGQQRPLLDMVQNRQVPQKTRQLAANLHNTLKQRDETQIEAALSDHTDLLKPPLPKYEADRTSLRGVMSYLDEAVYARYIEGFQRELDAAGPEVDVTIKGLMHDQITRMKDARKRLAKPLEDLLNAPSDADYEQLIAGVGYDVIVIMNQKDDAEERRHRLVGASSLLRRNESERAPDDEASADEEKHNIYLGEERLTGAIASLLQKHDPKVVLTNIGMYNPLSPRNQPATYFVIGNMIARSRFELDVWHVDPRRRGGQMPQIKEEQKAVWVYLESPEPEPPGVLFGPDHKAMVDAIRQRLDAGDGAMLVLGPRRRETANNFTTRVQDDPVDDLLEEFGVRIRRDRVVMTERAVERDRTLPKTWHVIKKWPTDSRIGVALQGVQGLFFGASPLSLPSEETMKKKGLTVHKLVTLSEPRMWAATLPNADGSDPPKYNEDLAEDEFVFAAAIENKQGQRLIVTSSAVWAVDGVLVQYERRGRGAQLTFPANPELFVNSTYWLAGLDEMIAASARRQDERRVGALSEPAVKTINGLMLAGLPLIVVAIGLTVWFMRRG